MQRVEGLFYKQNGDGVTPMQKIENTIKEWRKATHT